MAQILVDEAHHAAGEAYLSALARIGFIPDGLFWARDKIDDRLVLVLVSRFFDSAGPLTLSRLLFRAYRGAITPSEVNPLDLRLHSPNQTLMREFIAAAKAPAAAGAVYSDDVLDIPLDAILLLNTEVAQSPAPLQDWQLIERNVERLAA